MPKGIMVNIKLFLVHRDPENIFTDKMYKLGYIKIGNYRQKLIYFYKGK